MSAPRVVARAVDALLEAAVVPSFTRVGYEVRRRLEGWRGLHTYDLRGRVILLTGGTSGLGLAAARQLARCGATLVLVSRSAERLQGVRDVLAAETGNEQIDFIEADLANLGSVRALAAEFLRRHDRLDVLIHNAGLLLDRRQSNEEGIELTVAAQVVGPFLLTGLLLDVLLRSAPARVLWMSSGGMYLAPLEVEDLELDASVYRGPRQYALAKRAQVVLAALWARRLQGTRVAVHALHPGWVDTPGMSEALPAFTRALGRWVRSPEEGADTLVWLAADDAGLAPNAGFWHDRRTRPLHRWFGTRATDTASRRLELWASCEAKSGWWWSDRRIARFLSGPVRDSSPS